MTDHIVVFEGNERLIGRTISVQIEEATAFTLFGTVVTGEQIGVDMLEVGGTDGNCHAAASACPCSEACFSPLFAKSDMYSLPRRMTEVKAAIFEALDLK